MCPPAEGRVLLHACCAPCSGAILESLVAAGLDVTVFWSNSNITPREEYDLRLGELQRYCALLGVPMVVDTYDHEAWLCEAAAGREDAPERGSRCSACFKFRLCRAALYAAREGFACLTTTLASSRWKDLSQVDEAGLAAVALAREQVSGSQLVWWGANWRKGGLQPRRAEVIKEQNFYNQTWCGCEFSQRAASSVPTNSNKTQYE
ncbi:MAG: epoxyqueuosine reductase QueH [Bacteroidales bacterium]|nr:epoxyqueuosine reductase QueH [Candidatus Cryptobacteroides aphodequi]